MIGKKRTLPDRFFAAAKQMTTFGPLSRAVFKASPADYRIHTGIGHVIFFTFYSDQQETPAVRADIITMLRP